MKVIILNHFTRKIGVYLLGLEKFRCEITEPEGSIIDEV